MITARSVEMLVRLCTVRHGRTIVKSQFQLKPRSNGQKWRASFRNSCATGYGHLEFYDFFIPFKKNQKKFQLRLKKPIFWRISNRGSQKMIPCVNNRSIECLLPLYIKSEEAVIRTIFNRSLPIFHRRMMGATRNSVPVGIAEKFVSSLILGGLFVIHSISVTTRRHPLGSGVRAEIQPSDCFTDPSQFPSMHYKAGRFTAVIYPGTQIR